MAGEQPEAFPDELREWVDERAAERDVDPATVMSRAVAAYRYLDEEAGEVDDADGASLDSLADDLATLTDRVATVEDDLDEKIADTRERVVQVKREADAKAPRDHSHPDLEDFLDELADELEETRTRVESVTDRVDRGFENFEEILEYLTDATDDLDRKVNTLAGVTTGLRTELRQVSAEAHQRQAVDDLRTEASRHGERTAACEDCGATIALGLLARPRCPHCEATFIEFDPPRGFFGASTLLTGDHPALESGPAAGADPAPEAEAETEASPTDLFEDDAAQDDAPDVMTDD